MGVRWVGIIDIFEMIICDVIKQNQSEVGKIQFSFF